MTSGATGPATSSRVRSTILSLVLPLLFSSLLATGPTTLFADPGPRLGPKVIAAAEAAPAIPADRDGKVAPATRPLDPTTSLEHFAPWYPFELRPPFTGAGYRGVDDPRVVYAGNARFTIDAEPLIPDALRSRSGLDAEGRFTAGYWIVQFTDGVTPALKKRLDTLTGETIAPDGRGLSRWYIPNRAHIAWVAKAEVIEEIFSWPEVAGVAPYHPAYKLSPAIGFTPLTSPERIGRKTYLLNVDLIPGHSATAVKSELADRGLRVISQVYIPGRKTYDVHYLIVEAAPDQVTTVALVEGVRFIQEAGDGLRLHDLSGGGKLQNRSLVVDDGSNSPIVTATDYPLWLTHDLQGQGQFIGVVDSSFDWNNVGTAGCANGFPDLAIDNFGYADPVTATLLHPTIGTGGVSLKIPRADLLGGATLVGGSANEHGAGVAGAAAADFYGNDSTKFWEHDVDVWETWSPSNFSGLLGPGIAHEAQLYLTPVDDNAGAFQWQSAGEFETNMGITLTNMANAGVSTTNHSVGLLEANNTYTATTVVHDTKGFDHLDMLQCMAAGNDGAVANALTSQSVAKNVLAVGASDDVLRFEDRATFSSIGPRFDGALKPEIMAPGEDSAPRTGGTASRLILPNTNGSSTASCAYQFTGGTSFSSPTIAGAGALVHQYFEEGRYTGPTPLLDPSAAMIRAMLINAGERLVGANLGDNTYPNEYQGWGEPNLSEVFDFGTGIRTLYVEDIAPADGFSNAASPAHTYNVNVTSSGEPLKVTLSWTDEPGSTGTAKKLINDLHLTATSPSGTTYRGNFFDGAAGQSAPGGTADTLDTTESVIRLAPELGSWTITIDPFDGNFSVNQGYALVVTGAVALTPPDCDMNGIPDPDDILAGAPDCNGNGIPDSCEPDCNANGTADSCDLTSGIETDCNGNLIPDSCDIAAGTETDCDGNGVPDSCQLGAGEPDCNGNGQLDSCDIALGTSFDCDLSGVPDECEAVIFQSFTSTPGTDIINTLPPTVDTITVGTPFVITDLDVELQITHTWIGDLTITLASPAGTSIGLKAQSNLDVDNIDVIFDDAGVPYSEADLSSALVMQPQVDPLSIVNGEDPAGTWTITVTDGFNFDDGTLDLWRLFISGDSGPVPDCDSDGVPDDCELDCNTNGVPDDCDISSGTSSDGNGNGIPDECEAADCNGNGVPDDQDISNGTEADCDANTVPDSCQLNTDGDGLIDACDLDDDNDTWSDTDEAACGTDPLDAGSVPVDTDGDGTCDAIDTDDDGDGVTDALDSAPLDNTQCRDADGDGCDDCASGTDAPNDDGTDTDSDGLCDVGDTDDDGDGVTDALDSAPLDNTQCRDADGDGCDDCVSGTDAPNNDGTDTDSDGLCDAGDTDDDGDGVTDALDNAPLDNTLCRDADGDGCDDCGSGTDAPNNDGTDTDSDGLCDTGDLDDDGDTWSDADEAACGTDPLNAGSVPTDTDTDGTCDALDTDDDGDGVTDALDSAPLDNTQCRDADGDGCDDCVSGTDAPNNDGLDTDSDGLCDTGDLDDDGDGWSDADEAACGTDPLNASSIPTDTDADGTCDAIDSDDDGDGVTDALDNAPLDNTQCRDADGDGCDDCVSGTDAPNNDGTDTDSDGLCDTGDLDDDGDTWSDADEAACGTDPLNAGSVPTDTDTDGTCDALDTDDDGDGVTDALDSAPLDNTQCRDADGDGCDDCVSGTDAPNNDGLDTDSDGLCDTGDLDDDGDGWSDADEAACGTDPLNASSMPTDTDADGTCDAIDTDDDGDGVTDALDSAPLDNTQCRDADGDGCDDCVSGTDAPNNDGLDTDSDGLCDSGDLDDDNDTWSDVDEAACGTDPLDASSVPTDTDADGTCDAIDTDDDGDGVTDALDNAPLDNTQCRDADGDGCDDCTSGTDAPNNDGTDTDSDGLCDTGDLDDDGDTWSDADEAACGTDPLDNGSVPVDSDGDGTCDAIDADTDNDGVIDALDSAPLDPNVCRDADGDGCDDCTSGTDAPNNDGTDTDSDGLCDTGDLDDDGDTWSDADEAACGTDPLNASSIPTDTDADGTCDAIDADDDGDGVTDALDSAPLDNTQCRDADGDGCDDCTSGTDAPNNDGLDTDSDGLCDAGDLDDDGDTWSDADEAACGTDPLNASSVPTDTDADGTCDAIDTDDDGDGVTDALDSAPLDNTQCRDADGDGCDDCSSGTDAPLNDGTDTDSDGLCDSGDLDDDGDGVLDGEDNAPLDNFSCRDLDGDGCDDCSSGTDAPANDGADGDADGICDLGDACPGFDDTIDCNSNGVPDGCDISGGTSSDTNSNGIPDECEGAQFVRSDANGDGNLDISDPITTLGVLFQGQTALCLVALDANDSDEVNIADVIYSLSSLFGTGSPPSAPYPTCGLDPTPGALSCDAFPACP